MQWHATTIEEVLKEISSQSKGLSTEEAGKREREFGLNVLVGKKKKPAWMLFLDQFKDFMIIVLTAAAIISGFLGDITDTIIILVIVLLNAIVGFVQEYRAEKAIEALKKMATPQATVLRDGKYISIISDKLVPGDIVSLEAGNVVPADLRLIEIHSLRIEESSLTGESVPVDKNIDPVKNGDVPLGDRINMAYKSTLVTNGRGVGVAVGTGMNTEIGKIATLLQGQEPPTPLQRRMNDFGRKLSYLILGICVLLFGVGMLRGEEPIRMLLVSISLAVAAIPEALPALITIALAKGAKRLVKQNVLIRKLPAVETLGSVTVICSDKTGTLTQNKMKVLEVHPLDGNIKLHPELSLLESAMGLNHDVRKAEEGWLGDPTEIAMVEYLIQKYGEEKVKSLMDSIQREDELPFDSDRKRMTTIHKFNDKYIILSKGAVESISEILNEGEKSENLIKQSDELSAKGMRVLGYGYRIVDQLPTNHVLHEIERGLSFVGYVGMIDPPREEAKLAIQECKTAGIRPVMITGDHRATAAAIATEIGILEENGLVVAGDELSRMSDTEFREKVERIRVYARVSPEQKLNIVKALQDRNHFVAMTGDGVNDAPSLRSANIGIAMGITGTDVSKEAAHMILLDDNFATIVKAVKEGRRIYDNIRKFVKYIMTCNGAEILTIFAAPLVGLPIPLLPIHILWINLVTDGLPGLALSSEKAERNIMHRPPRKTDENLFAGGITVHIIWVGMLMAFLTLGIQAWAIHSERENWQTMVFTALSLAQLGHVMAIRSDQSIYKRGFLSNLPLAGAVLFTIILQLGVVYLPYANGIFKTQPLSINELLICFGVAVLVFHGVELEKWIRSRKKSLLV